VSKTTINADVFFNKSKVLKRPDCKQGSNWPICKQGYHWPNCKQGSNAPDCTVRLR